MLLAIRRDDGSLRSAPGKVMAGGPDLERFGPMRQLAHDELEPQTRVGPAPPIDELIGYLRRTVPLQLLLHDVGVPGGTSTILPVS